jgi:hypothetical protein
MITKCEHPGCTKSGTCRAPKTRDLKEYWWFCKEHAAEYNKNWNYYANMTPDEIDAEWERETFGIADRDKATANKNEADYVKFINDFISGRDTFDKMPAKKAVSSTIRSAFQTFEMPITASWREIGAKYRALAKKYHPDTAIHKESSTAEFTRITAAYETLKKYFKK